jgi:uncharacterized membrane protein
MAGYVNKHGRRPGRGLRPWLLLPKLLAVSVFLGGLVAALALWLEGGWHRLDKADPARLALVERVSRLFICVIVPALLAAMTLGLALLLHHGRIMLRLRWLQVKLVLVAIGVPTMHHFMSDRLGQLRRAATEQVWNTAAADHFTWGLVGLIAWTACLVALGRLKPRLGQNWSRSFKPEA